MQIQDATHNEQTENECHTNEAKQAKKDARMQRRNSLTLDFRQDDEEDKELVGEEFQLRQEGTLQRELSRDLITSPEPELLDLGDLASLLMPPKIVKEQRLRQATKKKLSIRQRRGSC